jgi:hypothetical protein
LKSQVGKSSGLRIVREPAVGLLHTTAELGTMRYLGSFKGLTRAEVAKKLAPAFRARGSKR